MAQDKSRPKLKKFYFSKIKSQGENKKKRVPIFIDTLWSLELWSFGVKTLSSQYTLKYSDSFHL